MGNLKMSFVYLHKSLRATRQRQFPNIKDFHKAGGPAPDTTTKIESGDITVRPATFERYCRVLGLDPNEFLPPQLGDGDRRHLIEIKKPICLIFKPYTPPTNADTRWRSSRLVVGISPLDICLASGALAPVEVEKIALSYSQHKDDLDAAENSFLAEFWSKHDKDRSRSAHPELPDQAIWLGMAPNESLGQGSTILPFAVSPERQRVSSEVICQNPNSRSWRDFVMKDLTIFRNEGIWFRIACDYTDENRIGRRVEATFHIQPAFIERVLKLSDGKIEGKPFKYEFVSFLQFEV
jgi:hypothetical protein